MTIYDYYDQPSLRKKMIFSYWESYAQINGYKFDVKSATKNQISFVLWNEEKTLVITPTYITMYETPTGKLIAKKLNNKF